MRPWPLWGVAAGALGYVGHVLTIASPTDAQRHGGAAVVDALDRNAYHVGVVAGLAAVLCLLVFAAGWQRWAARTAPDSLAARVVTLALVASAGAMILGYGFKGALAVYLPGGMDHGDFPREGLYTLFVIDDLGPFIAWYGVAMAAAAVAWLSLRERALPRWIGVVSVVGFLVPVVFLALTGLSGFPGVVDPLWLIVTATGLAIAARERAPARIA